MISFIFKDIKQIKFGLMSPEDIRAMSVVDVNVSYPYDDEGFPIENSIMDSRLGVIDSNLICKTCGLQVGECSGHFGHIELARPVIHFGFADIIHKILRSTCNECGRILLTEEQIEQYSIKIRDALNNKKSINDILKEIYHNAKKELEYCHNDIIDSKYCCPHCGAPQEVISLDKPITIRQGDCKLTPSEVRQRLERITDEDSFVLGVNPEVARPEWLVLTVLPVPPLTVRPSITLDTGERYEDDLSHKLVDILRINERLLENMEAGAPQLIVEDLWELLQYHVTTYFDNGASGVPPARHRSGRPLKTLIQRLKGRNGRFNVTLSGKRVNFSARTVISPDPNISINEVGVPKMIAKEVTVPVYVTEWNIGEIKKYVKNGPSIYPGANSVILNDNKDIIKIDVDVSKEVILKQLQPGCVVERHLINGDLILFNRQPSLHRMSMMAHEVRVLPYKTFRLNLCVCPPYNADFDGDEMNMHVFQTDESRAEAKSLMRVQEHILSPRFGGPIIGAIHDHISGAYLLTRDGVEFSEEDALQIIRKSHLKIPEFKSGQWILKYNPDHSEESFIYKEKGEKWTGKELFSLLLPNDLNLSYNAEISKCPVVYPEDDKSVVIINGILFQGVIDESAYGSFSGKILDKIVKEYGSERAKEFLDSSTKMAICAITKFGITTSLNDEEIPDEAQDRINEHLDKKMAEVDKLVESYEEGYLQALPGRSLEETLEMKIMQVLGEARDMSGQIAENYLTMGKQSEDDPYEHVMAVENHSVVMARTGARASMLNLTQITACVGQQAVRGGRIERGYLNRTLPHFKKGELGAKAKGFVHSSYKSGLDPIEFFFHAMGGREGLVDTAIRTAQSGYMQRRLVNALQDLQVKPSGLVTDNQGNVIQTMFGEDGVDPAKSDFGKVADLDKLIEDIRLGNLRDKRIEFFKKQKKINSLKVKSKNLIKEFNLLKKYAIDEIKNIEEYNIDNNFNSIILEIDNLIELLNNFEYMDNIEKFSKTYIDTNNSLESLKLMFNNEINRINPIILVIKKKNVIKTVEPIEKLISQNFMDINLQIKEIGILKTNWRELFYKINDLKENLSDNLKIIFNPIINNLFEIQNKLDDALKGLNNYKTENSNFELKLNNLLEYDEVNNDFTDYYNLLNSENEKFIKKLMDSHNDINQIKILLDRENSKYENILIELNIKDIQESSEEGVVDKLREYHNLLNEGIITQDEFNELKKQLIFGKKCG